VVQRDGDVFGRNVIAASRIASQAASGQVLVSALTKQLVESSGDLAFSAGMEVSLRGLAQPWTLHEVHQAAPV
jgi:class 3 adenylate cyclase